MTEQCDRCGDPLTDGKLSMYETWGTVELFSYRLQLKKIRITLCMRCYSEEYVETETIGDWDE